MLKTSEDFFGIWQISEENFSVSVFFVSAESVLTQTKRTRKLFDDCV